MLAFYLPDERWHDAAIPVIERALLDGVESLPLIQSEVANGLVMAERRHRVAADAVQAALANFLAWPLTLHATDKTTVLGSVALAREHGLTAYDASYLFLAHRLRVPLATFDMDLRRVAPTTGVTLMPETL